MSVTTLTLAFALILFGSISEVIGRKNIMSLSMLLSSLICFATAFSLTFEAVIIYRIIQGIVLAGVPAIAMAYLNEEIGSKSVGTAMGLYISANAIGAIFGRVLAGYLGEYFGWNFAIGTIGVISLVSSIVFVSTLPASKNFVKRQPEINKLFKSLIDHLRNKHLLSLFFIGFILQGSNMAIYNYIFFVFIEPPFSVDRAIANSLFLVIVLGVISSTWIGRIVDSYGFEKAYLIGIGSILLGLSFTLSNQLIIVIFGLALFTFSFFAAHSISSSLVGRLAINNKAQASSLYLFFYYSGSSVLGTLGGAVFAYYDWNGLVILITFFLIIAFILALFVIRSYKTNV